MIDEYIKKTIRDQGYIFISNWYPEKDTEYIANMAGTYLRISGLSKHSNIPDIQSLKPRNKSADLRNQYSGYFGLECFPFHTDLAHWHYPPRYILLRCVKGTSSVATTMISTSALFSKLGLDIFKKAVVIPRKTNASGITCALPVIFNDRNLLGVRWDSLFLVSINNASKKIHKFMTSDSIGEIDIKYEYLQEPGDTLIIDNWKMLHGRTSVDKNSLDRIIERAYLNNIK